MKFNWWRLKIHRLKPVLLGGCLTRVGDFENQLAGAREAHFFPRDAFDGFGIGLQRVDLLGQSFVFVIHLADLLADLFDFLLCAAHRDKSGRAEHVMYQQGKQS